ncbi:Thiocyanate methyltransferase, partial [Lachnellula suecica]
MPDQPTDARARLLSHFTNVDTAQHPSKWDELWKDDFLPWDKGFPNPALVDLLDERQGLFSPPPVRRKRKALVPGCGKGYDVLLLAAHGYDAYGLEYSTKALESARIVEGE